MKTEMKKGATMCIKGCLILRGKNRGVREIELAIIGPHRH